MEINDGDLVRQVRDVDNYGKGLTGTYRRLGADHAIIYDKKTTFGHDLCGVCRHRYGWYLHCVTDVEPLIIPYDPTQGNEEDDV